MIYLTLCLTHDCNLRCGYCYAGRKRAVSMSRKTAFRSIDFGLQQACREGKALGKMPEIQIGFLAGNPCWNGLFFRNAGNMRKQSPPAPEST